jgi:hypothetical protein
LTVLGWRFVAAELVPIGPGEREPQNRRVEIVFY